MVAIYARVSTVNKQDFSRQVNELKAIAKTHGFADSQINVYAESISGYKKDERIQLQQLLLEITNSPAKYKCIYTSEISRIGRNPLETRRIIDDLTEKGIPVYIQSLNQSTIDKDGKRNMIMNIILQVLMEYSNLEAETFKARSKSGLLHSAKNGKAGGGKNLPYGYEKNADGLLVVNPKEEHVIKEIFELYSKGNGIKVISGILNNKAIPTRMNITHKNKRIKFKIEKDGSKIRWSDKQVHDIIRNTLYAGERRFKGEIISAPNIISKDQFEKCKEIRESKTHRNYLTTYTYLLKDKLICGCCGRNYFAKYKPVKGGDKVYICSSRLTKGNCGNLGVNISFLESVVLNVLKTYLSKLSTRPDSIEKLKSQLIGEIEILKNQLMNIHKKLERKISQEKRLLDLYLDLAITRSIFEAKKNQIKSDLVSINQQLSIVDRDIKEKKDHLNKIEENKNKSIEPFNAKTGRSELSAIFNQMLRFIIIAKINDTVAFANIFIQINTLRLMPFRVFLDLSGVRKRPNIYKYYSTSKLSSQVYFDGNKLTTLREIQQEFKRSNKRWNWSEIELENRIEL